jgi:ubiquinone/menaquinone biosynthesis C-methylase UbiE
MQTKAYRGLGMEGWVARWYANITGKDPSDLKALAACIVSQLPPGAQVLEVAPGPGYLAIEIAESGDFRVAGLDISHTFVEIGRNNARQRGVEVDFRQGDAAHMPFADETFQFLVCRAAFKNFTEPAQAIKEMHRVLAPGGTALLIDLRKDASPEAIKEAVDEMHLGTITHCSRETHFASCS